MICASIKANNIKEVLNKIEKVDKKVELFEIRTDYLKSTDNLKALSKYSDKIIIAIRTKGQNEVFNNFKKLISPTLLEFIKLRPYFIDVEINSNIVEKILKISKKYDIKVLLSYHNFNQTPDLNELKNLELKAKEMSADAVKIVTYATRIKDNLTIIRLLSSAEMPMVAFCMGELGKFSRVFSPFFGALFTYASVKRGEETAPGQLTVDELIRIWKELRLI